MDKNMETRQKIVDMLSIIKVAIIAFIIIIGYINSSEYWYQLRKIKNEKFNIYISLFSMFNIILLFFLDFN